ncbi:MAG: hypothetical protein JNL98_01955 [Bryobacterales bacterium]|nr:hypothetical protein [Bryobacterales bacterium]
MRNDPSDEKELMNLWQDHILQPPVNTQALIDSMAERMKQFDRRVFWRNFREYAAGIVLVPVFLKVTLEGKTALEVAAGAFSVLSVLFVMCYLWRTQQQQKPLDPSLDLRDYQAALLARYDRQIALLKSVRYWYVLPLWASAITLVAVKARDPWSRRVGGFAAAMTLLSAGVVWLNEVYGVRKLREERDRIATEAKYSEE